MEQHEDSNGDEALKPAGHSARMTAMLDGAITAFQRKWGQEIREQRQQIASLGITPGFDVFAQVLPQMGISLSPEDIKQIEEGTYPNIDVRLLLAVCMALEVGADKAMRAALTQAASEHQAG